MLAKKRISTRKRVYESQGGDYMKHNRVLALFCLNCMATERPKIHNAPLHIHGCQSARIYENFEIFFFFYFLLCSAKIVYFDMY